MSRLKVFVSSTYYDLRHIRSNLELFISELGYEAVLFENGSVAFDPGSPLDDSCYEEVKGCDIFVLIIGGRYGSIASSDIQATKKIASDKLEKAISELNSVTKKEYLTAREKDIPVYVFVEKAVASEYRTYLRNKDKADVEYAHVEHVGVFKLLSEIYSQGKNNLVREFERSSEIEDWLKSQWSGLFVALLRSRGQQRELHELNAQLNELRAINEGLKKYSESIMKKLDIEGAATEIKQADKRIRDARLDSFLASPMINWVVNKASKYGLRINIRQWGPKFAQANSIKEFLEAVGFSADQIDDMYSTHSEPLERDFVIYRKRYFSDTSKIDLIELEELPAQVREAIISTRNRMPSRASSKKASGSKRPASSGVGPKKPSKKVARTTRPNRK
jgi:hypothetical protein